MKTKFVANMTRTFHKAGLQLKKHSPEILIVTGVIGTVASAVMACKATTKIDEVLGETKDKLSIIDQSAENGYVMNPSTGEVVPYTEEDHKKDTTIVYGQTGLKFAKLYGPSVALGAISLTCILTSHNIMRKRNVALAAAYATEHLGFKEYRGRLIERFGKELDKELKYNIKAKEVDAVKVDENGNPVVDENGEVQTEKKTIHTAGPNYASDYARFFDEYCNGWTRDAEYNLMFLRQQQNWANEKLKRDGYLFLNDVYEMLGIQKTKAGQIVGWVYDEGNVYGDNYVDFGIYDLYNEQARDFVNGREKSILLDFNVDGNILDMI